MTTNVCQEYRRLLASPGIVVQPTVPTPLAARIAERIGFEALSLGGYAMGATSAVTEPLLSIADVVSHTSSITQSTSLPLLVDVGTGYGDPIHIASTVRRMEHAGAAGVHLEDQIYPKRAHYHRGIEHIVDADEMVERIDAATRARTDGDFVICARTDAMLTAGYDHAIERARRYAAAGADIVMLFPNDRDETMRAPRDLPEIPLVYVNSTGNRLDRGVFSTGELDSWGWKVVYDAITTTNVTAVALRAVLTRLHEMGDSAQDPDAMTEIRKYIEDTIGLEELYDMERRTVEHA